MTEKRYKSIGANLECPSGTEYMLIKRNDGFNVCQVCGKYTAKEIVDELNSLADENELLKEIIKFRCDMEICETCKHGYYWITDDFFGKEGNFKCLKGHPADECCELKKCKDYEIEDLNEMLQRVKG